MAKRAGTVSADEPPAKKREVTSLADLESDDSAISASEEEDVAMGGEEEEGGEDEESGEEEADGAPGTNGATLRKKSSRPLSAEEIQAARETAELFKSNIFKLQIDELIKEVKLKELHTLLVEKVLHKLHELVEAVPAVLGLTLQQAEALFDAKKLAIPFPDPKPSNPNLRFAYAAPEDVQLVGSFGLKTAIHQQHGQTVDMVLTMPAALFQPKDYLNYRAFYKRSFYLAHLAKHLMKLSKQQHLPIKLLYTLHNDDPLNVALRVELIATNDPADLVFAKTKFAINLLVGFPAGVFDAKKLLPDRNCIRVQVPSRGNDAVVDGAPPPQLPPTPLYNLLVLTSVNYGHYLRFLYATKKQTEAFRDACQLGKIWLQQRGFTLLCAPNGGFGSFEFSLLMAVLLAGGGTEGNKILLHGFLLYQLFKGTMRYLATMDLCEGYLLFRLQVSGENLAVLALFDPTGGFSVPTLFDRTSKVNVLWKLSRLRYEQLRQMARQTLLLLGDVVQDRFDAIFLQKCSQPYLAYDAQVRVPLKELQLEEKFGPLEKISFLTYHRFVAFRVELILLKALGNRIHSLAVVVDSTPSTFQVTRRKPATSTEGTITIGINLNPEECDKVLTKGPRSDETTAAAEFQAFWGSKALLRRFKDGSIQHSIVWSDGTNTPVVWSIVQYVLDLHLQQGISRHMQLDMQLFDDKLPVPLVAGAQGLPVASLSTFQKQRTAQDQLIKAIMAMSSDLPLHVRAVLPSSANSRYALMFQPVPYAFASPEYFAELVLQFELLTRWPDELVALERTKSAFLMKVQEGLAGEDGYRCFMVRDTETLPQFADMYTLDVVVPSGYGFRIRVLTERDEVLYLRAVANTHKQRAQLQDVYLRFNQRYMAGVKHTRLVTMLAQFYNYYLPTVRLFKRWLDSQMLLCHMLDPLVELLALVPFVEPAPYHTPLLVQNGLLRILAFVARWNWKEDPLVVDLVRKDALGELDEQLLGALLGKLAHLADHMLAQQYQQILDNFAQVRQQDPQATKTQLFVGTREDMLGIMWSRHLLVPIALRLTALARAAVLLVDKQGVTSAVVESLFTPSYGDYDFTLRVTGGSGLEVALGVLPRNAFKNLLVDAQQCPEDITSKMDPVQLLYGELVALFSPAVVFLVHRYTGAGGDGGNVICGVFDPLFSGKRKFKVNLGYNIKPAGGDEVVLNRKAVLSEVLRVAGDMVVSFAKK